MRTLLDYVIDGPLGRGSTALVHRARRLPGGSPVALKCPLLAGEHAEAALLHEARMLRRCTHPNVVRLVEIVRMGESDPPLALALQLAAGGTLAQLTRDGHPLDPGVTARIGLDIAQALAAIHREGIVHADVKPANIMIDADGRAVLIDFESSFDTGSTSDRQRRLTERYAAPEVLEGHPPSPASDVWALATVLIEAAWPQHGPASPGTLVDILRPCTDPDPARRPTADTLVPALRAVPPSHLELARLPPPPVEPEDPARAGGVERRHHPEGTTEDPHPTVIWGPRPPNALEDQLRPRFDRARSATGSATRSAPRRPPGIDRRRRAGILTTVAGAVLGVVGIIALAGWASDTFSGPSPSLATGGDDLSAGLTLDPVTPSQDGASPTSSAAAPSPLTGAACAAGSTSDHQNESADSEGAPASPSVELAGDIEGIGCTRSVRWDPDAAVATVRWASGPRQYALGRAGDQFVLGDWDADGRVTPGLYRPSTGATFLFDGWAEPEAPLPSAEVIDTGTIGGIAAVRTAVPGTSDHLIVDPP